MSEFSTKEIRELPAGDVVTGFYLLSRLEVRPRRNGAPYLVLELQDPTGRIEGQFWEGFEEFQSETQVGQVVKVQGTVGRWQGVARIQVQRARIATPDEAPEPNAFLPRSERSTEEMEQELFEIIGSLTESLLRQLLEEIFKEVWPRFAEAPGGNCGIMPISEGSQNIRCPWRACAIFWRDTTHRSIASC